MMAEDKTKLTQELQKQIEKQLEEYHKYFVYENRGDCITAIHQDREMACEILNGLYSLICEVGNLKQEKEG